MAWQRAIGHADGAARGNPGPAGAGGVLQDVDTGEIVELARFLGTATNNVAEYTALIMVLEEAKARGVRELVMCSDSELLVRQLGGQYKVKAEHLRGLYRQALALLDDFERIELKHVRRELNREADRMSNRAIDERARI